jgi:hypothetical protein
MRRVRRSLVPAGLGLGLVACRPTPSPEPPPVDATEDARGPAAKTSRGERLDADVPLVDGGVMALQDQRGKVVVLAIVLTSSPTFTALSVAVGDAARQHPDLVTAVLVAADPNPDALLHHAGADVIAGLDPQGALATRLQVRGLPAVFVLDRKGQVVEVWAGEGDVAAQQLSAAVDRALAAPP